MFARREPPTYHAQADFVFVLGMHRSGTSCLAGCLQRCGLYLGDVQLHNRDNQRGNHELKAVERLHDRILAKNKGGWNRPPERIETGWLDRLRLARIVSTLKRHPPCGIKDPRILLFLDTWFATVRIYTIIGTYRHPMAVVQSLQKRNAITYEDGISLWLIYNSILVSLHKKYHFALISFDLTDKDLYCHIIARCAEYLGLRPELEQIRDFVSLELQHQFSEHLPVPEPCQELYSYLENHRQVP